MKQLIVTALLLLAATVPSVGQSPVNVDSATAEQDLQSRVNATDAAAADSAPATPVQTASAPSTSSADNGSAMLILGLSALCGIVGVVMSLIAFSKIKAARQEKASEFAALKTVLKQQNDEQEKRFRQIEAQLALMRGDTRQLSGAAVFRPSVAVPNRSAHAAAEKKKAAAAAKVFLSRPDDNGYFMAVSDRLEPGNSLFLLTTKDGVTGTFEVISDAGVHQLALMMPTATLTRACKGPDIQVSAGKSRIVTDAPGSAVREGKLWRITEQATIHYE